jgi:large subunit ribosomal protein L36e
MKGTAIGINKGFIKQAIPNKKKLARPSRRRGHLSKRVDLVRQVIREVAGFAPYEKRIIELLRIGGSKESKRALKMAKARLGTHRRGVLKRAALEEALRAQRKREKN